MKEELSHFDDKKNAVMVDISEKIKSCRVAVAKGKIRMNKETFNIVKEGTAKKGDVLGVSRIAGIMACKKTPTLIPMCHAIMIDSCKIDFFLNEEQCDVEAVCTVKTEGKTGVEMEALTGVCTTLLTIYDMCKSADKSMLMHSIYLQEKKGGKSKQFIRDSGLGDI